MIFYNFTNTCQTTNKIRNKERCPICAEDGKDTNSDNMVTFSDTGHKYCVVHGNIYDNSAKLGVFQTTPNTSKVVNIMTMTDGEYSAITSRGIEKKTCEAYGYQINREKGVHIANYYDVAGNIVMQQHRTIDKKFPIFGNKEYNKTLWRLDKFNPNKNLFITITEGQLDCLSIAQVFDCKYPVVSLPNGVKAAEEVISMAMDKLVGFKHVVLAFDNDGPGRETTERCLKLFEPGSVKIVKWPEKYKDANEMLVDGKEHELRQLVYNAVEYTPPSILTGQSLLDKLKEFKPRSIDWPWESFKRRLNPIYVPGIYTIAGLPGVGKTILMAEIMRATIAEGKKVGIISLEESVQKMLLKLTSIITGVELRGIRNRQITEEEIELCRSTAENIVTYDHKTYGSDLITIISNLPYIARALNCEVIIFDNLSYSATNATDDERRAIDRAMIGLKDSSTKYEYVLFNICHLNDDGSDSESNDSTIRGSRGVQMYSDYVIHLSRDVESQDLNIRNILTFHVKKDRESGEDTGKTVKLRYNVDKQRLEDL